MTTIRTIASAIDLVAAKSPTRLALTSPFQGGEKLTYQDLSRTTNALAAWLSTYGFEKNDLIVSDLPNTSENLLLQIACNRIGVGYGTAKDLEFMAKNFVKVQGAVSAVDSGFLAKVGLPFPYLSGEFLRDLIDNGLNAFMDEDLDEGDEFTNHAFYNSATGYTNQQALLHGSEAANALRITGDDTICISVTLCHPFGMGSAACSAFLSGAAIALPAVGGIQGCGVPSERAAATLSVLESEKCTILFADTHTLKALPEPSHRLSLRDGVVKIGSGTAFLSERREYGGVHLKTMGKEEP